MRPHEPDPPDDVAGLVVIGSGPAGKASAQAYREAGGAGRVVIITADDAPPYFTIVIVGHFVVGGVLALEKAFAPSMWLHSLIWLPLTVVASMWLLPRVKGALIGLQWALYMHGFEDAWRRGSAKPRASTT